MRNVATDGHATSSTAGCKEDLAQAVREYEDNPDDVYTLDEIRADLGLK